MDVYKVLGVDRSAPSEVIDAAHRALAKKHHPDRNPSDPNAAARFRTIQEAYETLSNPARREAWDRAHPVGSYRPPAPPRPPQNPPGAAPKPPPSSTAEQPRASSRPSGESASKSSTTESEHSSASQEPFLARSDRTIGRGWQLGVLALLIVVVGFLIVQRYGHEEEDSLSSALTAEDLSLLGQAPTARARTVFSTSGTGSTFTGTAPVISFLPGTYRVSVTVDSRRPIFFEAILSPGDRPGRTSPTIFSQSVSTDSGVIFVTIDIDTSESFELVVSCPSGVAWWLAATRID